MEHNHTDSTDYELSYTIRKSIGVTLLCLTLCFLLFYMYIFVLLLVHKLWKINSFYLWFISLAVGDITVLTIYVYTTLTVIMEEHMLSDNITGWLDAVNDFFCITCYFTHPSMAAVRMLSIVYPMNSRQCLTNFKTLLQIAAVWLMGLVNVVIVDSFIAGDSGVFNPKRMAWEMADLDLYHESGLHHYWSGVNAICVILALSFYAVCLFKLRQSKLKTRSPFSSSRTSMTRNTNGATSSSSSLSKAEINLIKIGCVLTVLFIADNILWQISQDRLIRARHWWLPLMFTVMDIVFYGMNSVMLATLSSDIQKRMCSNFSLTIGRNILSTHDSQRSANANVSS